MLNGQLNADDQAAVVDMLHAAAEVGDPAAEYDMGLCLAHGIGVSQDGQAALTWIPPFGKGWVSGRNTDAGAAYCECLIAFLRPLVCPHLDDNTISLD